MPIDVKAQGIDLMSFTGHKIHGPKGCGALYIRRGVRLQNLIDGGAQERSRRAGTENTAGIVGLAAAVKEATKDIPGRVARLTKLRDKLIAGASKIDRSHLNGHPTKRMAGNFNMCFEGIEGESLLLSLDLKAFAVPLVLPAPPAPWIPATCCCPWACLTKSPTALCGSL